MDTKVRLRAESRRGSRNDLSPSVSPDRETSSKTSPGKSPVFPRKENNHVNNNHSPEKTSPPEKSSSTSSKCNS